MISVTARAGARANSEAGPKGGGQDARRKEKRFPRESKPIASFLRGFFDSPLTAAQPKSGPRLRRGRSLDARTSGSQARIGSPMARSKNGAHPVRRPTGPEPSQKSHIKALARHSREGGNPGTLIFKDLKSMDPRLRGGDDQTFHHAPILRWVPDGFASLHGPSKTLFPGLTSPQVQPSGASQRASRLGRMLPRLAGAPLHPLRHAQGREQSA